MNKLDTSLLGGFPFELNDLEWQFLAYNRAFTDLCNGFGSSFILHGCERTTVGVNTYDISAGAIVMSGEIYPFEAVTALVISAPSEAFFAVSATLDPSGSEVFEDLVTRNAYQKRVATIVQTPSPPSPNALVFGPRLADAIYGLINTNTIAWQTLTLVNGWIENVSPFRDFIYYRRELGKVVRLRGKLIGNSATNAVALTLPIGYRPAYNFQAVLHSLADPSITAIASVSTTGQVSVGTFGGADQMFTLEQVPAFEAQ
jgi:hypothetical protein